MWCVTATAGTLAATVGMAALILFSMRGEEPAYRGMKMSAWAAQLGDASPTAQAQAAQALGRIGKKASGHARALTGVLEGTAHLKSDVEADLAIAIVDSLYNMNDDFSDLSPMASEEAELRSVIPRLKRYKQNIYQSLQAYEKLMAECDSSELAALTLRVARFQRVYNAIDSRITDIIWIRSSDPY